MSSTPLSGRTRGLPPTSSKNSITNKTATSPSRPPTHRFSMSHTPPLHPSKRSLHRPCSEYASLQTAWGTTPQYPLGQLRPSSAWRTTTSPTPRAPSLTASSPPSPAAARSPTNASPKPADASISCKGQCTHERPKSAVSETTTPPPTCRTITSETEGEWTSRCPPMEGRTSSHGGSGSWGMGRSSPEPASEPTNQNTWSPSISHQTTQHAPPPYSPPGFSSFSKPTEELTTPWLRQRVDSNTPQLSQKWSGTAATTCIGPNSKWLAEQSPPTSTKKTTRFRGLNIAWKRTGSTNASPHSRAGWTSARNSPGATTSSPTAQTLVDTAGVDQEVPSEERVMLLPEQAAELLPWYMQWSWELATEMHRRRLIRDKACRTN